MEKQILSEVETQIRFWVSKNLPPNFKFREGQLEKIKEIVANVAYNTKQRHLNFSMQMSMEVLIF